jgi:hypothetical protein
MKNFRTWLNINENAEGGTKELYHATLSGPNNEILNSFIQKGIDPTIAKGFSQGAGFYMFTNKNNALNHMKSLESNQNTSGFKKEMPVQGKPILVVSDEPITPECFDIDYEVFGHAFAKFFKDNEDYFRKNAQKLNLRILGKPTAQKRLGAIFHPEIENPGFVPGHVVFPAFDMDDVDAMTFDPEKGGTVSKFAEKLAKLDPNMFGKFEEEYLRLSPAIKYNCKKKIWPARIEDINGKILWQRN